MSKKVIAVTGATGFTGGHVVEDLLRHGHTVHACVRDAGSARCDFLNQLPHAATNLRLFNNCDFTKMGSFDRAFTGVDAVVHVAAVIELNFKRCAFAEVIQPGVDGCREIAAAATRCGVRRIVFTASASLVDQLEHFRELPYRGRLITEHEERLDLRPSQACYVVEKMLSERALMQAFDGEVISLLPSLIIGPQQNKEIRSSMTVLDLLINRVAPCFPPMYAGWIDARDVATAHRLACELPPRQIAEKKRRFIISSEEVIGIECIAKAIDQQFPHLHVPLVRMPMWLMHVASCFDARLTPYTVGELTVRRSGMSSARAAAELGFTRRYTSLAETARDIVRSFQQQGIVVAEGKRRSISSTLTRMVGVAVVVGIAAAWFFWTYIKK